MKRRDFLAHASGPVLARGALAAPREKRNVVLLYCEQFQHNVASFAGGPARTPNLERFAQEAVDFRTACTTTGLCSPARSALFTGRLGHRTGLDDNCHVWHSRLTGLSETHTTLIEWARRKDYFIGYYGKWHLGKDGPIARGAHRYPATGFERGKERDGKSGPKPDFARIRKYYEPGAKFTEKPGFYETARGTYEDSPTHRLAQSGAAFLSEAKSSGKPFFLTVSFNAVHPPYDVPKPYDTMYDYRSVQLPANLRDTFKGKPPYQPDIMWPFHDTAHLSDDDWRRSISYYRGFVTMLDRALGEVIDGLRANGLADNTMVVVIADHGDMNGAHNRFDKGPYCYDEIVRIPLLVRAPGVRARKVDRHVSSIDLNRTLTEWMGLEPDSPNVDSRSLLGLMERGDAGWDAPDQAFYRYEWYNGLWFGIRSIRTPRFKYCFNPAAMDELYDLKADPGEMTNLAGKPALAPVERDLQTRLLEHLRATEDKMLYEKLKAYMA